MDLKGISRRFHSAAWLLGAWLVLLGASAAAAGSQIPPEQVMSDLSHTMIATLKRDRAEVNAHPQRLFQLVDQVKASLQRVFGALDERLWILIAPLGEHCRPPSSEQVDGGAADPAWTGGSTPADEEVMLE